MALKLLPHGMHWIPESPTFCSEHFVSPFLPFRERFYVSNLYFPDLDLVGDLESEVITREGSRFARLPEGLFRLHELRLEGTPEPLSIIKFNGMKYLHRSSGNFDESKMSEADKAHLDRMIYILNVTNPVEHMHRLASQAATEEEALRLYIQSMRPVVEGIARSEADLSEKEKAAHAQVVAHIKACSETLSNHKLASSQLTYSMTEKVADKDAAQRTKKISALSAEWLKAYGFSGLSKRELAIVDGGEAINANETLSAAAQYRKNHNVLRVSALHVSASIGDAQLVEGIINLVNEQITGDVIAKRPEELILPLQESLAFSEVVAKSKAVAKLELPSLVPAKAKQPAQVSVDEDTVRTLQKTLSYAPISNIRDAVECTPLHYAARKGYLDVFETLLRYGADVMAFDLAGNTPVHDAAAAGHLSILKLIFEPSATLKETSSVASFQKEAKRFPFGTILSAAIANRKLDVTRYLSQVAGCLSANAATFLDGSPTIMAVKNLDTSLLKEIVVSGGFDATARDPIHQLSLVHLAVCGNGTEAEIIAVLDVLHNAKVPLNLAAPTGATAMHAAVSSAKTKVVEWLRSRGVPYADIRR